MQCHEEILVVIPRIRCPTCSRDYAIETITHTCGEVVRCQRPPTRERERYLPRTTDDRDVQSVECEECKDTVARAKILRVSMCAGCGYTGKFVPGADGKCAQCNAPKKVRRSTYIYNLPEAAPPQDQPAPIEEQPRDMMYVRFKFVVPDKVFLIGFTLQGENKSILGCNIFDESPRRVDEALRELRKTYDIKIVQPDISGDLDVKFIQLYHSYKHPDKFPINFY